MHFNSQKSPSRDQWIPKVVENHFMEICFSAWSGYLHHQKGLVLFEVDLSRSQSPIHLTYLSLEKAIAHFERLEFFPEDIKNLSQAIEHCDPQSEIILMLTGKGEQLVTRLENLKILPEQAYQEVCARWEEYSSSLGNLLKI